jgi:MFS family permease
MLLTVCSAQGLVQASLAQSFLPNLVIGDTFKAQSTDTAWYPAAYGLTSGVFMLAFGQIGDLIGHKPPRYDYPYTIFSALRKVDFVSPTLPPIASTYRVEL